MKAKEYYEKYKEPLTSAKSYDENLIVLAQLMNEFKDDFYSILELRKVKTDLGLFALIREFNQKWNALIRLFEKDFGVGILKENGFVRFMADRLEVDEEEFIKLVLPGRSIK